MKVNGYLFVFVSFYDFLIELLNYKDSVVFCSCYCQHNVKYNLE